jgi:succinate dehydrogenase / fumarate reductase cytochrome b subunit
MVQERPLSPHLMVYKPQLTSIMSITHRMTGTAMAAGSLLLVWWVVALASGPEHFAHAQSIIASPIGQIILFCFSLALYYHLSNGIRHLFWDFGYNLSIKGVMRTGYMVILATVLLTAATWAAILLV